MKRAPIFTLVACLLVGGCADDGEAEEGSTSETGDGDGDPGDGDGDGDPGDGDGDGDPGDGDGDSGDGDGDSGDGDGDGDSGDGDGDGDSGDGDSGDGDGDACGQNFATCDDLVAAFSAETDGIRSCSSDSECGQELAGTSCGCTRNWVARTDADTTCFYDLIDQAGPLQCDLGLGSTCDCPEADGFACEAGTCTWNYL